MKYSSVPKLQRVVWRIGNLRLFEMNEHNETWVSVWAHSSNKAYIILSRGNMNIIDHVWQWVIGLSGISTDFWIMSFRTYRLDYPYQVIYASCVCFALWADWSFKNHIYFWTATLSAVVTVYRKVDELLICDIMRFDILGNTCFSFLSMAE